MDGYSLPGSACRTAAPMVAQTASSPSAVGGLATGVQTPLKFGGASAPSSLASFNLGVSTLYDDNIYQNNLERVGDEELSINSQARIVRQTAGTNLDFDYAPFFNLYRQHSEFNQVNQAASLSFTSALSSRWTLGLHDRFSYINGAYPTLGNQQIPAGPPSPTALNEAVLTPTVRTLSDAGGADLTFSESNRTSLTLSGTYNQQKFSGQTAANQQLYSSRAFSGGVQYQYRVTERTNLGVTVLHQDSTFSGGEIFGSNLRTQTERCFLRWGQRSPPAFRLRFLADRITFTRLAVSCPGRRSQANFACRRWQHHQGSSPDRLQSCRGEIASSGGGLYPETVQTTASLGVRRRLAAAGK